MKVPEEEVFYFLTAITKNESFTLLKNEKNNEHESLTYEDGSEGDFVEDPRDNYLQMIDLESFKTESGGITTKTSRYDFISICLWIEM